MNITILNIAFSTVCYQYWIDLL